MSALGLKPARVLVTGCTRYDDVLSIVEALRLCRQHAAAGAKSFRIITGMAEGADEIARLWAKENGVHLLAEALEAGDYPGPMHAYNHLMLDWHPELVLAFKTDFARDWDRADCIKGTEHMCRIAAETGLPVLLNGSVWLSKPLGHRLA